MLGSDLARVSAECLQLLDRWGLTVATAESCTGGLIAAALTDHAGASRVMNRGFVVYSNDAKVEVLGVSPSVLASCGAVSEEVARAMVSGTLHNTCADLAVAVTGIAGPGGATPEKPVGLVHIAAGRRRDAVRHERLLLEGGRAEIRTRAAVRALELVMRTIESP